MKPKKNKKRKKKDNLDDLFNKNLANWHKEVVKERIEQLEKIFDGTAEYLPLWALMLPRYRHLLDKRISFDTKESK